MEEKIGNYLKLNDKDLFNEILLKLLFEEKPYSELKTKKDFVNFIIEIYELMLKPKSGFLEGNFHKNNVIHLIGKRNLSHKFLKNVFEYFNNNVRHECLSNTGSYSLAAFYTYDGNELNLFFVFKKLQDVETTDEEDQIMNNLIDELKNDISMLENY